MEKISVIIPVYNSEDYIGQCVQSLINQTYPNWEALLIDDGSTDHSLELCENLSRTDGRIKVYHDDAIHPLLLEEMMRQWKGHRVKMAFCNFAKVDNRQLDETLAAASPQDRRPQWQIGDGAESERWFHIDHAEVLCGISGMMSRDLIGALRFDETLSFGEDTLFKYVLFRKQVRTAYTSQQQYYYRTNAKDFLRRIEPALGEVYSEKTVRIRDSEYQRGNMRYVLIRETELSTQFRQRHESCKKSGRKERCGQIETAALRECGDPLFQSIDFFHKDLFYLCFKCYPLYVPVSRTLDVVWTLMEGAGKTDDHLLLFR